MDTYSEEQKDQKPDGLDRMLTLIRTDYTPRKGHLDELVRDFIQSRLSFRFVVFQTDDSDQIVRRLEREIQSGQHQNQLPTINSSIKN